MEPLFHQIVRVQRKMQLELFLNRLGPCLLFALVIAVLAIAVPKMLAIERLPSLWTTWWTAGCLGAGGLAAWVWIWLRRASLLNAAIEIDSRCQLHERVASAFLLSPEHVQSSAGRALTADAARALNRIDIDQYFSVRPSWCAWLPLVPATLVLLVAVWIDPVASDLPGARGNLQAVLPGRTQLQMDDAAKVLEKQMIEHREEAARQGQKDVESLFRDLEKEVEQLQGPRQIKDRKQRLVKLNDLAGRLAGWHRQAGGEQALRKELGRMKNLGHGPADRFAKAVKEGNLQHATSALDDLRKQLEQGTLDQEPGNEAMGQLQRQMGRMRDQLQAAANSGQQATQHTIRKIDQEHLREDARRQGDQPEPKRYQQSLDEKAPQSDRDSPLRTMAEQMAACERGLRLGNRQAAADAVGNLVRQVDQMCQEKAKNELLDVALSQIQAAKDAINGKPCSGCQGAGCNQCQPNQLGQGQETAGGKLPGLGTGLRRDEPNRTEFHDVRIRSNPGSASDALTHPVAGSNRPGEVPETLKQEMTTWKSEPADPLVFQRLPRSYREHAEQYFNKIREGR